ncbi:Response regulator receiver domain protein (plasmid) [Caballeronia sp. SBC1]|uniref:response regulator n=1 Tax=unclassified Caballeronia TaxID=2646786 RepID=UPI0013E1F1F3|nr:MULTISPECIES: response regulator [unclassified Caballeronia]QIE29399.1 Response regulator receiver domain protein [Caballeronia sp. SBC2]QIN67173.1 Response regulator receiver domain protein [Caballeronia sp. SBC1]
MLSSAGKLHHLWTNRRVQVNGEQMRVLVVDDNHNAAEALATYLSFENLQCRMAFGGVEAIAVGIAWAPHAIIMDISMPGCSGFEAALTLRQDGRTCGIAIVAFTALDESEVRSHIIDSEFDGYCQKGQTPANLVALVMSMAC